MIKKFFIVFLALTLLFCTSCAKKSKLVPFVSELREIIYEGNCPDYTIKAHYGFKEKMHVADGIVSEKTYNLTIMLLNLTSYSKITASITLNGEVFTETFTYNPVSSLLTVCFPVKNAENCYDLILSENGKTQTVTITSIIPENTLSYKQALIEFEKQQPSLIKNYEVGTEFHAELQMRILMREGKPYWYLGIIDKSGNTKALLLDGFSGKILAIKDVF